VVDTSLPYASVVEEYSGTATVPSARYDYGDDLVRMDRGGVFYYLCDGLGSTRQFVNTVGGVTDTWGYSALGELVSRTNTGIPTANPFLFNAQQFDVASGDYYLRARYYDQSSGRFISQDPYEGDNKDTISLHRYLYASDNPVNIVDPDGQSGEIIDVAFSMAISASVGSSLTYLTVAALGGDQNQRIRAAVYGFEGGAALAYSYGTGKLGITLISGLIGAVTVIGLDALVTPKDFAKPGAPALDAIEGFATAATTTALSDGINIWQQAAIAGGLTFLQDELDKLLDDYNPQKEEGEATKTFSWEKQTALAAGDATAAAIIAIGAGASLGTQFNGKIVKEAKKLTEGKSAEEVSEKVVTFVFGEIQVIASGIAKVFDKMLGEQGVPSKADQAAD